MDDLGWANGWDETPEIVKKCKEEKHKVIRDDSGNFCHLIKCYICGYFYYYDSS